MRLNPRYTLPLMFWRQVATINWRRVVFLAFLWWFTLTIPGCNLLLQPHPCNPRLLASCE